MARKARQRISYVLPLEKTPWGHRLGVNGLTVDAEQSILYSGGRDGLICAWNLKYTSASQVHAALPASRGTGFVQNTDNRNVSVFRQQVQAHTHWINDIALVRDNSALVSASSDLTVKLWRPDSESSQAPNTIGLHNDYVKCLASPGIHADWVASGGLDHKIKVWDLNGGGEKLQIDIGKHENNAKGSVYALSATGSIMASGGPESIIRLWDPKSGNRITNFVGHTDNIRDILINHDGNTVMTASSDQTIKIWSITAGRCMYTLTMHNDSVWSLFSNHPQLSIFYSTDRSGLVAKTDVRDSSDMDQGLSLAIAQEHEGINKIVAAGDYIWTATSSSSINRWRDVDTKMEIQALDASPIRGASAVTFHSKITTDQHAMPSSVDSAAKTKIPLSSLLQISSNAIFPGGKQGDLDFSNIYAGISLMKFSEPSSDAESGMVIAYQDLPEETIEGQNGLIKHLLLNDRRRVLTLDTAGEVMMWDLLSCLPIQSFGKRHLEDVAPEVNTTEIVPNWCSVDTRTGRLACILEEIYCFDAELYADDLGIEDHAEGKDDVRVNLGHWVLRSLFANLIEEEFDRDTKFRTSLVHSQRFHPTGRQNAPLHIQLPSAPLFEESKVQSKERSPLGSRNIVLSPVATPGLSIGLATPYVSNTNTSTQAHNQSSSQPNERHSLEKDQHQSQSRTSSDKSSDYFSSNPTSTENHVVIPTTPGKTSMDAASHPPVDQEKEEKFKESTTLFKKRFRMNFPKKLGRSPVEPKPVPNDEKSEESDKSEGKDDKGIEDNFFGTIQNIRKEYEERFHRDPYQQIPTLLDSGLPGVELLKPPPYTTIIIQEDQPDSGGVADLYQGTVKSLGQDADLIEKTAPMWLGELLLRGKPPPKEISKVAFILLPYEDLLPHVPVLDGSPRLTANRMLRAKKILAYVAEHLETPAEIEDDPEGLKPEEYFELYCHNQLIPPSTTLATLRVHYWKNPGDVVLYYKSNGRKASLERKVKVKIDTPEDSSALNSSQPLKG